MRKLLGRPVFWIAVIIVCAVVVGMLGACGSPNQAQPVVCATYQAPDGMWREEDGERMDADPCDTDDQFEDWGGYDSRKKPKSKPSSQPIGGKKKKF